MLLLGEFLLAAGQIGELLHRFVNSLLLLLLLGAGIRFVLVLVLVQFQIKQISQIATGTPTTASAPPATALLNLNIPEGGFGTQEVLQRLLFGSERILEGLRLQLFHCGRHGGNRRVHFLYELRHGSSGRIELPGSGTICE